MKLQILRKTLIGALGATVALGALTTAPAEAASKPTNWTNRTTFHTADGHDVPLRYGRANSVGQEGFGWYHIEEEREVTELQYKAIVKDIDFVLAKCKPVFNTKTRKATCSRHEASADIWYYVVITDRVDKASGDGRPVGVITYYYNQVCGC